MPPAKRTHEDPQSLKEKLHSLQGGNGRGRRNGNANGANSTTGSNLKEVMSNADNASINSGQNEHTSGVSGLSLPPRSYRSREAFLLTSFSFRYAGAPKTRPFFKTIAVPTVSILPLPSRTPSATSSSPKASAAFRPQWHGQRTRGESKRSSLPWLSGRTSMPRL
jgi:hypothetical protein